MFGHSLIGTPWSFGGRPLQVDGFVVVTTPHELAKLDALRSINMIRKLNVKVLGVVENFTGEVFGSGVGKSLADSTGVPFLGQFELRSDYRKHGGPTALASDAVKKEYEHVASGMLRQLDAVATG